MPLTNNKRYEAAYLGFADGRRVFGVSCCNSWVADRKVAAYLGFANDRRVFGASCTPGSVQSKRTASYLGFAAGRRVFGAQGDCAGNFHGLDCCQGVVLPDTIHATFTSPGGCPCLEGMVVVLTFNGTAWVGSSTDNNCGGGMAPFGANMTVTFSCAGGAGSCDDFTLTLDFENHGIIGPSNPFPFGGCSCPPLNVSFEMVPIPNPGTECDGTSFIPVTITL